MQPLTFGSLFSGIGGFDLGFQRAGMVCRWQVEIDAACRQVLARHWPDVPRYEDVKNVGDGTLAPVDVICGGFPCQDVSVAGKRAGLAGERSGLWFEFHRILGELHPRWAVIENVPGLLSSNGGRDFAAIVSGLVELGYRVAWRVLDAQYFGVAQRRRRVFLVASLGTGSAAQVLFESEGGGWHPAPSRASGARVAPTIESGANRVSGRQGELCPIAFGGNNTSGPINVATACNAHGGAGRFDFESETFVTATLNSGGNNGGFRTEPGEHLVTAFDWQSGGDVRLNISNHHTSALQANQTPAVNVMAFTERTRVDGRNLEAQEELAYALTNPGGGGRAHSRQIAGGFGVRRLTPTECERLQGFPDGWTDHQSDSSRYGQLGNAVCESVVEWIGRRIVAAEAAPCNP
jgi:DNA (cytosine-5)-methyltransferase 1